jgi:hypothetical protein
MKVVTQVCQTTLQPECVDCRNQVFGNLKCDQLLTAKRETTMVVVAVSGRP